MASACVYQHPFHQREKNTEARMRTPLFVGREPTQRFHLAMRIYGGFCLADSGDNVYVSDVVSLVCLNAQHAAVVLSNRLKGIVNLLW